MKTPLKILLATDYSEAVMNAERYAVQFALQNSAFLQILHVFQPPQAEIYPVFEPEKIDSNPIVVEMQTLKKHVSTIFSALHANSNEMPHQTVVREGMAGTQICDEAKEIGADLIIVGTHGESGFEQLMPGNHTWNVIRKAEVPVLAVPKHGFYTGIKNVVFVTEYDEAEIPSINYLAGFVEQFQAELILLHITNPDFTTQFEKEISAPFYIKLGATVKYPHLSKRVIHHGDMLDGLNTFCTNIGADWVATSIEKLNFLERLFTSNGDLAKKLSLHTHIPLLTIPQAFADKKVTVMEEEMMSDMHL